MIMDAPMLEMIHVYTLALHVSWRVQGRGREGERGIGETERGIRERERGTGERGGHRRERHFRRLAEAARNEATTRFA